MKAVKTITDPESFQLLADPTRRKVIFLLRVKQMTVSEIASQLGLTPQAVYHHIRKLQKAGLVEVVKEVRMGHLIESYYMTTAESFNFRMGREGGMKTQSHKVALEQVKELLEALKKLGFDVRYNDRQLEKLVGLVYDSHNTAALEQYEAAIEEMDDLSYVTKLFLEECVLILSGTDKEHARRIESERELGDLLRSLVMKP